MVSWCTAGLVFLGMLESTPAFYEMIFPEKKENILFPSIMCLFKSPDVQRSAVCPIPKTSERQLIVTPKHHLPLSMNTWWRNKV